MKTSNTRAVTGLYMASGKKDPLHIGGTIDGKAQRICSLPAHLNNGNVPNARELRGIIEGRSVVAASTLRAEQLAQWLPAELVSFITYNRLVAVHPTVAHEYSLRRLTNGAIYAVRTAPGKVATIGPFATQGEAEKAALAHLRSINLDGVTIERDSTAGDNGALVDVERVTDKGAVIGHVFAACNPAAGQVQFKAQALGGALVAWHSDFIMAVAALVAHCRQPAAPKVDLTKRDLPAPPSFVSVDMGDTRTNRDILEAHRRTLQAQREARESSEPLYYIAKTARDGSPMADAWTRVSRATYEWNEADGWPVRMETTGAQYLAALAAMVQA